VKPAEFQGTWREDVESRAVYSESAGILRSIPAAVAVPRDAEDVQHVLRHASVTGTSVTARGAGSSMPGGALGEGILLDLSNLAWLEAPDVSWCRIRSGPGVSCAAIQRAAATCGLRFPVDPSSSPFCTIGGMVATNAAGPHSLRFGATSDWVSALDCVFADGSRAVIRRGAPLPSGNRTLERVARRAGEWRRRAAAIEAPRVRKNSSGYAIHRFLSSGDAIDLLVGSEGTLAVFVGIELRLTTQPLESAAVLSQWPDLQSALAGAAISREAGCASCEILDNSFLDLLRRAGTNLARRPAAILFTELEADAPQEEVTTVWGSTTRERERTGLAARLVALQEALRSAGALVTRSAVGEHEVAKLWSIRQGASPASGNLVPGLFSLQVVEDGCVPPEHFAEYVVQLQDAISRRGFTAVLFGHAGDAHLHANVLVDVASPRWRERLVELLYDAAGLVARLGGTLAGEHGDGRLRAPLLGQVWPEEALSLFREIKETFDPLGILNPGVKLPDSAPPPAIKYDPLVPPLPEVSRRVLAFVNERQAYDRPRLALLEAARSGDLGG
jgi:FAD/FMN-containing dehydrogenase